MKVDIKKGEPSPKKSSLPANIIMIERQGYVSNNNILKVKFYYVASTSYNVFFCYRL